MTLPLLAYSPTAQNQRVRSFGAADLNEDTPYLFRVEGITAPSDIDRLIWAAYRQVFNEQEILRFNRQLTLESQLKNHRITVRDFIRGLAKSDRFYQLVVEPNNNYRLVELCLKRLFGRAPYNQEEVIAWSIQIATRGWEGFVDALIDSEEYVQAFGDDIVPYQRKRLAERPFSFTTRYGEDYRDREGIVQTGWQSTWQRYVLLAEAFAKKVDWPVVSGLIIGSILLLAFFFFAIGLASNAS